MNSHFGFFAQANGPGWTMPVTRPSTSALVEGGSWEAIWSLVAGALLLLALVVWIGSRLRGASAPAAVRAQLRPELLVPIGIQTTLLLYWGLYHSAVADQWVMIAASLAFGLGLDLLLRLATRDEAVVHLATIPLVLSVHLFVWFEELHAGLIFVVVTIALVSKVFVQRNGRHIFNPSALGITVVGIACYVAPDSLRYVDIAHALNTPPNMFEAILLLALVAQFRAPIVLVSLAAAATQYIAIAVTGGGALIPSVHWAPVTLAVVLLVTDPATIPRSGGGRVMFGVGYAAVMISLSLGLEARGVSDFFTKVIPVPIMNLLAPTLDRWAETLPETLASWLEPRHNRAHVAIWLVTMCLPWWLIGGKANLFEGRFHPLYGTPHIVSTGPTATCEDNPTFCLPFSFPAEVALWVDDDPPPVVKRSP